MKASWSGYLSLGNLKVPVQLYSALKSSPTAFTQLHALDHSPTGRAIICLKEGREIPASELIRAVKRGDTYVELSDSELELSSDGEKLIQVRQFSNTSEIRPKYYDKPYYIVPAAGGELAYALLRQAFVKADKVAVATYVYYQKQHIGLVMVEDGILMLQQLRFASELIPRGDIKTPSIPQPLPAQVDVAVQLMNRYSTPFYLEDYRNEHEDRLDELVERKAKGLAPKRRKAIAPKTTKEEAVVPVLEELLRSPVSDHIPT